MVYDLYDLSFIYIYTVYIMYLEPSYALNDWRKLKNLSTCIYPSIYLSQHQTAQLGGKTRDQSHDHLIGKPPLYPPSYKAQREFHSNCINVFHLSVHLHMTVCEFVHPCVCVFFCWFCYRLQHNFGSCKEEKLCSVNLLSIFIFASFAQMSN